jgi:hypothetical protein
MTAEVVPLGEKLIAQEAELDRLFARRVVTPSSVGSATTASGATQAELHNAHLKYHLLTSGPINDGAKPGSGGAPCIGIF